jgi:hypothetical protein
MTPLYYILLGALLTAIPFSWIVWGVRRGMPEIGDDLGRTAARTRQLTAKQRTDEGGGA